MVCSRYQKEFKYYETVLKRKCFKKLRNNVWENKTKWILLKKADHHYRMKLLYNSVSFWVAYLNKCYRKKINYRAAEAFYEEKLKTRGLLALKRNIELNSMVLRICKQRFELNLKYWCWHQWKHYIQKRLKVKEIKLLADRIREKRLTVRLFYLWLFHLNEKRSLQDAYKTAARKHETKLKAKYFKYWRIFAGKQICKMKIEKLAISCCEYKLKERYFRLWKNYTSKRKQYKYQMIVIKNFYVNYLLKNYVGQWFTMYKEFKLKKKISKYNSAVHLYESKLLKRSLIILRNAKETKKARGKKTQKFHEIYIKTYLNFYINLWMEKRTEKIVLNLLESKAIKWREEYLRELFIYKLLEKYRERLEEREEVAKVIKYSHAIIVHRAFRGWCEVTCRRINKKILLENSSKFYNERLIKNSFEKWNEFIFKRSQKKTATDYYRLVLLSRIMNQWKFFFTKRKLKLAEAENLGKKHNTKLLRNAFDFWKSDVITSKSKLNAAVDFYDKSKLSKAFRTWKNNIRMKTVNKSCYNRNKTILNGIMIKNIIFRWYEMHSVKQKIMKKLQEIKLKQEKRTLRSYFNSWHNFVEKIKSVQQNVKVYSLLRNNILMGQYLILLVKAVNSKKSFNKKEELAKVIDEKMLKRRYLRKWLSFICWKRERFSRCITKERGFDSKETLEFSIPVGKSSRRKPMIPAYLKVDFTFDHFEEEDLANQETFRVMEPVNKKLPIIGQNENLAYFEL